MSEAELALLTQYIPAGGHVLEFGCGGSTVHFLENGVGSLTSVESDLAWLESMIEHPAPRVFLKKKRWFPMHIDIGPVARWGYPVFKGPEARWLDYHQTCWDAMPRTAYDLIFIDGRFRVACFCQSLLRCANPGVVIAVHDFWDRPHYRAILEFAEVVDKAGTMAILGPRAAASREDLNRVLDQYRFVPE